MQCSNNLKQLGLAVHNFVDGQRGLPPVLMSAARGGVFNFLYPYLEQNALWELQTSAGGIPSAAGGIITKSNNGTEPLTGLLSRTGVMIGGGIESEYWFEHLDLYNPELRNAFASVSAYLCPSRGNTGWSDYYRTGSTGTSSNYVGPRSDYTPLIARPYAVIAKVMTGEYAAFAASNADFPNAGAAITSTPRLAYLYNADKFWCAARSYDGGTGYQYTHRNESVLTGPYAAPEDFNHALPHAQYTFANDGNGIRIGQVVGDYNWLANYEFSNDFAYWQDGSSNILVIGEKNVPKWCLNFRQEYNPSGYTNPTGHNIQYWRGKGQWNGSYVETWSSANPMRYGNAYRVVGPETRMASGPGDNRVELEAGVAEPMMDEVGSENYGLGAAHTGVVQFAVGDGSVHSLTYDISSEILYGLAQVNDGEAVSLP
jgi:hypothetical protein